jgi:hypothetical protein
MCEDCMKKNGSPLNSKGRPLTIAQQVRIETHRRVLAIMKGRQQPGCEPLPMLSEDQRKPSVSKSARFDAHGAVDSHIIVGGVPLDSRLIGHDERTTFQVRRPAEMSPMCNTVLMQRARESGLYDKVLAEVAKEMGVCSRHTKTVSM